MEADLTRGDWRDPDAGAVNFGECALKWVDEREPAATTDEPDRRLLRLHILPGFESSDHDQITAPKGREWRAERRKATGATTVAKSYRLLKAILETATDDKLIRRNPCRIRGAGKESPAEREIATVEQVDALAEAVGIRWRLMVYLGAYGPLRPEEQAELRRKDVDVDTMTIRVRKAAPELNHRRPPPVRPPEHPNQRGEELLEPARPHLLRTLRIHQQTNASHAQQTLTAVVQAGREGAGRFPGIRPESGCGFRTFRLRCCGRNLTAGRTPRLRRAQRRRVLPGQGEADRLNARSAGRGDFYGRPAGPVSRSSFRARSRRPAQAG